MNWLKVADGYVRTDSIIDVHINKPYPIVWFVLTNGDSVKYKEFSSLDAAIVGMEEFLNWIYRGDQLINDIKLP